MKHTLVVRLLVAMGLCSLSLAAPRFAAAADPDKKPAQAGPAAAEYRLGPGDKLRIEVYKDPQLSQSLQVRPDGKITLPLIGDLDATGSTPLELRDKIATALKEFITNPTVTVIVVEAESAHAFIMGEVARPGPIMLHGPTTMLQGLALAGGFKEFANTKEVKVLRPTATGVQTLHFNYKDVVNGDSTKPFYLQSGDTIIVP
jgi:polysaccharide export outer membrane protein